MRTAVVRTAAVRTAVERTAVERTAVELSTARRTWRPAPGTGRAATAGSAPQGRRRPRALSPPR
ncbi:hypothetical protein ACNHYB_13475 [Isoptericola jiangsuensis]|uniref:hypothetical protein n=1 Tax=Isoptericola jiangsuensis TaxID=548579 RepID=UPI003AACB6E1